MEPEDSLEDGIRVPDSWWEVLDELEDEPGGGRILVVGPSDSGKTTLCRFLGRELAAERETVRVDCDPGQGEVGLPGTLGAAREPWSPGDEPLALRFVGSVSPARHFLQCLTGIVRLAERAGAEGAERLVFDSSGYMDTPAGREFHHQVVEGLAPDHLIALRRDRELAPLLKPLRRRARPRIHELEISPRVEPRSRERRRAYRTRRFAGYFAAARRAEVELDAVGWHGHVPPFGDPGSWRDLLVGLVGKDGFLLRAGIVRDLDPGPRLLTVEAPPFDPEGVASVAFGSERVELPGG